MDSRAIVLDTLLLAACVVLFASSHTTRARAQRATPASVAALALFLANVGVVLVGLLVSIATPDTFMAGDHLILPSSLLLVATLYRTSTRPAWRRDLATPRAIAWRAAIVLYLGAILLAM